MDEPTELTPRNLFLFGFFLELALVFVAALIGYSATGLPFPFSLMPHGETILWGLVATLPLLALSAVLTSRLGRKIRPFQRIYDKVKTILGAALCEMSLQDILLLSAAAGVGEEVLFRGVIQTVLGRHGLWVSSLLFGAMHALTFTYFVLAALLGLYLGWLFQETKNLVPPILVHAIYDAVALWLLRKRFREDLGETPVT